MPEVGTIWTFDYTGGEQVFKIPVSGIYKLETWGASGKSVSKVTAGYGGYSYGNIILNKNEIIYINIGGTGQYLYLDGITAESVKYAYGGYNGGGDSAAYWGWNYIGGGGGATHIATKSGVLSTLENSKLNIIIVSGGGAGSWYLDNNYYTAASGSGGGYKGSNGKGIFAVDGIGNDLYSSNPLGGGQEPSILTENTQSEYTYYIKGQFGLAAKNSGGSTEMTGAGGGYYGGDRAIHAAGGGSGYIGNPLLTNKAMYCYSCEESSEASTKTISTTCTSNTPTSNCAKQGNGYAKITLISY